MSRAATLDVARCDTVSLSGSCEQTQPLAPSDKAEQQARAQSEYEELIRDHSRVIAAAVRRVCAARYSALIPDVEQEIHVALWRRVQTGKEIHSPASYLYKVALTTALAVVRRQHPERETPMSSLGNGDDFEVADRITSEGGGRMQDHERSLLIDECLEMLGEDQARALRAYLAGFNHTEVAHLYGWSESAARHKIYRGIDALKKRFAQEPK